MPTVALFRALGDSTRLKMVERLSTRNSVTITSLINDLQMSRQGARKHLQVLADSKVIRLIQRGRETEVRLDPNAFDVGKKFMTKIESEWEKRLEKLKKVLEQ